MARRFFERLPGRIFRTAKVLVGLPYHTIRESRLLRSWIGENPEKRD
jgi:hypothetical protein